MTLVINSARAQFKEGTMETVMFKSTNVQVLLRIELVTSSRHGSSVVGIELSKPCRLSFNLLSFSARNHKTIK